MSQENALPGSILEDIRNQLFEMKAIMRAESNASLDKPQAAAYLGVSTRTIDRLVSDGQLDAVVLTRIEGGKKNGRVLFEREVLDEFRRRHRLSAKVG